MKKYTKLAVVSVLTGTLAACSSSSDSDPTDGTTNVVGPTTVPAADAPANDNGIITGPDTTVDSTPDTNIGGGVVVDDVADSTVGEPVVIDNTPDTTVDVVDTPPADDSTVADVAPPAADVTTDDVVDNTPPAEDTIADVVDVTPPADDTTADAGSGPEVADDTDTTTDADAADDVVEDTDSGTTPADDNGPGIPGITPSGISPLGNPPTLVDPFAAAIPSPDSNDPFGFDLETDNEEPVAGGAPTTPKNLRIDLISNDWAEINWAPANDDVAVEEYRIYRSDGHIYTIREDQTDPSNGARDEIAKIWRTTSFIDCNYTRFNDRVHFCDENGPVPGETYSYQMTAVDGEGQESPRSNSITITYQALSNAPVPRVDDFFKRPGDTFVQDHDLSDTAFFLDKFSLVFEDNFDGPEIDSDRWNTSLVWGDNFIINGEQQLFVDTQNATVIDYNPFNFEDGELIIEAIPTPDDVVDLLPPVCLEEDPTGNERCQFLSGALSSHDKFGITYGYVEGRMKVGGISGMLSSFYMYHRFPGTGRGLHGPEIDIVEYLGENPFGDEDAFQTYHFRDVNDGSVRSSPTMNFKNPTGELYADDYHTFGMLWEPQLVIWYIDGKEIQRLSGPQVGRQQMNIVTYLVAGSAWAPTPADDDSLFPLQYKIDYIRAYQRPEYSTNGIYPE